MSRVFEIDTKYEVQVMQVIRTSLKLIGNGKDDPFRRVTQYWSMEGQLLAEIDPHEGKLKAKEQRDVD